MMMKALVAAAAVMVAAPLSSQSEVADAPPAPEAESSDAVQTPNRPATAEENLDCAIWAAIISGNNEDPEISQGFGYGMSWFIGLWEGQTGRKIDRPFKERTQRLTQIDLVSLDEFCPPYLADFGDRLVVLGAELQAAEEPLEE